MPAKFDRCVRGVKKSSKGKVNPYAVCNASIKDNKSLDLIGSKIVESIYKKVLGNNIPFEILDKVIEEAKAQGLDPNLALAVLSEKAYRQDPKPSQNPPKKQEDPSWSISDYGDPNAPDDTAEEITKGVLLPGYDPIKSFRRGNYWTAAGEAVLEIPFLKPLKGLKVAKAGAKLVSGGSKVAAGAADVAKGASKASKSADDAAKVVTKASDEVGPNLTKKTMRATDDAMAGVARKIPKASKLGKNIVKGIARKTTNKLTPNFQFKSYSTSGESERKRESLEINYIKIDEQIHEFIKSVKLNEGMFKRLLKRGAKAVGKGLFNVAKEVALSPLTALKAAGSQARDEFEKRTSPESFAKRKELEAEANFQKKQQQNAERAAAKAKATEVKKRAITQAGFRAKRLASEKEDEDFRAKTNVKNIFTALAAQRADKQDEEKAKAEAKRKEDEEKDTDNDNLIGSRATDSIELFGQKIVEGVLRRVNEMKVNPMIDRKEVRRMKAAGVSKKARREFTADDVARKESDKKIKASMGPNNPKNTFKPKPKLNNKYIERGKKGTAETPMTKAQIDRSGTEGKPAAGRPGQTKAGVLKAKLAKIDRTSTAFMANLAKNPKNSEK